MEEITKQLLYQRLRNGVIDVLDLYCSFEALAEFGAFEAICMFDDLLPLEYDKAPDVFSPNEKAAVRAFMKLWEAASDATKKDTWSVADFESSEEWVQLCKAAQQSVLIFSERGRFSEDFEEPRLT